MIIAAHIHYHAHGLLRAVFNDPYGHKEKQKIFSDNAVKLSKIKT